MKVLVGSKNPVKIASVKEAFSKFYDNVEVEGISVPSDVPDQPHNDETFEGAKNRAVKLKELNPDADFFVGIEGGILNINKMWFSCGTIHIIDKEGREGIGSSPHFQLPDKIIKQLLERKELGKVMDEITNEENTKHKGGAIGFFTKGVMSRKDLYKAGIITALVPLLNKELF